MNGYAHFIRQTQTQSYILGKRTAASSKNYGVLFQSRYLRTPLHLPFWACCSHWGPGDFSAPSGLWLQRCGEQLAAWGRHQWTPADPLSAERRMGVVVGHSGTCKWNEMQRRSWCHSCRCCGLKPVLCMQTVWANSISNKVHEQFFQTLGFLRIPKQSVGPSQLSWCLDDEFFNSEILQAGAVEGLQWYTRQDVLTWSDYSKRTYKVMVHIVTLYA